MRKLLRGILTAVIFMAPLTAGARQNSSSQETVPAKSKDGKKLFGTAEALRVARALAAEDPSAHVLLCAVELCSLHYYYHWNPKKLVSNAIFADGAAALVIMSDTKAKELGITPLARIVSTAVTALSPEIMGYGPYEATKKALKLAGMSIGDIDLAELNEAFAAQVIPSYQDLGIDIDRLSVHGGAIALGHPFGMTGARIATTLLNGLQTQDKQFGLETMCVGGGQGMAMILERLS